jgi:cytochrome c peroxidase
MAARSAKNWRFGLRCFYAAQEASACHAGIRTGKTQFKLEADLIFFFFTGQKDIPDSPSIPSIVETQYGHYSGPKQQTQLFLPGHLSKVLLFVTAGSKHCS